MKFILSFFIFFYILFFPFSCSFIPQDDKSIKSNFHFGSLKLIGEKIIPDGLTYRNYLVGGFSGIDYSNGKYYVISDDKSRPIKLFELDFKFNDSWISDIKITDLISISSDEKFIDPESVRFDKSNGHIFWTSEGAIRKGISPSVFESDENGKVINKISVPEIFKVSKNNNFGPRQNGTFECLSITKDNNCLWLGMELPLMQDGNEPGLDNGKYPVRISKINKETGDVVYQFAYNLGKIPKDSKPSGKFKVNGLPEILSIDDNMFLFVERAYASGYSNGGNTVKIFLVDISNASDIKNTNSLNNSLYLPAKKTLLFDFECIRSQLTDGIVDNIEGICFGPDLPNGHKTIVVVSDNNFSKFNPQLNQIIVFEVLP